MINTLNEFLIICEISSADDIYELFEDDCTDEVRAEIYSHADETSPEPFRSAMENLGVTI